MKAIQKLQPTPITPTYGSQDLVSVPVEEYLTLKAIAQQYRGMYSTGKGKNPSQLLYFIAGAGVMFGLGLPVVLITNALFKPEPETITREVPVYIPTPVETPSPAPVPGNNQECRENCHNFSFF